MTLIVRADANRQIGFGHVMRSLALAEAWMSRGGQVVFVASSMPSSMEGRIIAEGMSTRHIPVERGTDSDVAALVEIATHERATWVVLDGYAFDSDYQRLLKDAGLRLVTMDDCHASAHSYADIIVNQNAQALKEQYEALEPYTRLLRGSSYALIRKEFFEARRIVDNGERGVQHILITFGGSDNAELVRQTLEAIRNLGVRGLQVRVVGAACDESMRDLMSDVETHGIDVRVLTDASEMATQMAWADLAISSCGVTSLELAFMGVPTLLVMTADNQRSNAMGFHEREAAMFMGERGELTVASLSDALARMLSSDELRRTLSIRARSLVDGRGGWRIVRSMLHPGIQLTPAQVEDCRLVWEWANEADVRAQSFTPGRIAWSEHERWFRDVMNDGRRQLFIGRDALGMPVGQIRVDEGGEGGVISLMVTKSSQGKGYGYEMIEACMEEYFEYGDAECLHAFVKPSNQRSAGMFRKAGFRLCDETVVRGEQALHFIVTRSER